MSDTPWAGDACSLVEAFRRGDHGPKEELEATLAAIESSQLNCVPFVDASAARDAAASADINLPFGGVPVLVKELDSVAGWPHTDASLVFRDRVAAHDSTMVARLRSRGGAVITGLATASEFGGLNVSRTLLHGTTTNPWGEGRTAGGSSGGSAAAVAGGLVTMATGGDGGGSIRIPAAFCGLPGMKGTAGRIPRGPHTEIAPLTVVIGGLVRSIRDIARWYDVCAGFDARDPYSLPPVEGWERLLGTHDLRGLRVAIAPTLGRAIVRTEVADAVVEAGEALVRNAGLELVDVPVEVPQLSLSWAMSNLVQLRRALGDRWPACADEMTAEIAFGMRLAEEHYNLDMAATVERERTEANECMAALFDTVDFVISATNPDIAYPADVMTNTRVGDQLVGIENNGALTIPANIVGNPSISVPIGTVGDLPVGMQIMGRHHADALLLDLGLVCERERPWALTAPGAPR